MTDPSTPLASGSADVTAPPPPSRRDAGKATRDLERDLSGVEGGRKWLKRLLVLVVLVGIIGGVVTWRTRHAPPPPPRYMTQTVGDGDVVETVQSTGVVKPVIEVKVGSQVSGRVARVHVDFNSLVKRGDLLAEIDPIILGAQVEQGRAQIMSQKAQIAHAEAALATTLVNLNRMKSLKAESLASQSDVDQAQGNYDVGFADLAQAKAQLSASAASMHAASANLSYAKIFAPIDGVITDRQIDPGQTVAASFQAPVLFVLAEDLRKMRIFADIDEADVGKLSEGMAAEAQVDAFPGEKFEGSVAQVRFAPNTVQGVVTYTAVVEVANPERKLRPGMTATVTVKTKEAKGAVRVPNAALRFKPSPERDKEGKPIPKPPEKALEAHTGRVFLLTDETPGAEKVEPRIIHIGVTDGIFTEMNGDGILPKGTKVVTDEADDKSKKGGKGIF